MQWVFYSRIMHYQTVATCFGMNATNGLVFPSNDKSIVIKNEYTVLVFFNQAAVNGSYPGDTLMYHFSKYAERKFFFQKMQEKKTTNSV